MVFDSMTFLYVLLFIGTLLFVEGAFFLVAEMRGGREKRINRRMRLIAGNSDIRAVLRKMRREGQGVFSQVLNRLAPWVNGLITQSGLDISTARLCLIMFGMTALFFSLGKLLIFWSTWAALLAGLLLGLGVPLLVLYVKRRRRQKRFIEQLPQAIDIIKTSLKAGHPVATACSLVATEMSDPIGSEFGILTDETTYGLDFDEALYNLSRRMPKEDVEFFVVCLTVARATGGNLAEILDNLAKVLRDRSRMHAKIRAISAEGRWSGFIMGLVPFFVTGTLMMFAPDYLGSVKDDPIFWPAMTVAGILLLLGHLIIYKLVRFRV